MPISVSCSCGKIFKVKDDMAGKSVKCQVCGLSQIVSVEIPTSPEPQAVEADNRDKKTCPACAEAIPKNALRCPFCKEDLSKSQSAEDHAAALASEIAAIEAHAADPDALKADAQMRGGFLSTKSIVIIAIELLSVIGIVVGAMGGRNMEGLLGLSIVSAAIFVIPVIVTLLNDRSASLIQVSPTADVAFKRYFASIQTGRYKSAFTALSPSARVAKNVESIKFANARIPVAGGRYSIGNPESFAAYWKTVFTGPAGNTRSLAFKSARVIEETDDAAIVEVTVSCTSYPSWVVFTILLNLLILLILYLVMRSTESKRFRKVMVKRNERWFVLEPGIEGPLDRVEAGALASANKVPAEVH